MRVAIIGAGGAGCTSLAKALTDMHTHDVEIVDNGEAIKEKIIATTQLDNRTKIDSLLGIYKPSNASQYRSKSDRKRDRRSRWD